MSLTCVFVSFAKLLLLFGDDYFNSSRSLKFCISAFAQMQQTFHHIYQLPSGGIHTSLSLYRLICSTCFAPSCSRNLRFQVLSGPYNSPSCWEPLLLCYSSNLRLPPCPLPLVCFFEITPFTGVCFHLHTWEYTKAAVGRVAVSMNLVLRKLE